MRAGHGSPPLLCTLMTVKPTTIAIALAATLFAPACGSVSPLTPPLTHDYPSADSLARAVLGALASKDRASLDALALSEQEFRDLVWPDLPASRPERNLPFSYVWGDLRQKSQSGLSATLSAHGGKPYELVRVTFKGDTPYANYRVHRDATFRVTIASGEEVDLRVCGSMLEKDGAWKVFSYVVD